ncbi:MAG TPA: hypothetical protein VEK08_16130 [Planctomycetota bacterium]|nr:hypothetical protein [Planctomycetota bacterium]
MSMVRNVCVALAFLLSALPALAEQALSITDYTGRGFAPDLVQYALPKAVDPKSVVLTDSKGQPVPAQVTQASDGALLSFIAQVPHDETVSWKFSTAGGQAAPKGSVKVEQAAGGLVLRNDRLSVTMPAAQEKTFTPPVAAKTLPAPITSWTSRGSAAMGASRILTERLVKKLRVHVPVQGDVYSDAQYEIEWAEGGYYRCTVRVMHQVPLATVREEYDIGKLDGSDFWELDLLRGWTPDTLETSQPWGNGGVDYTGTIKPMDWPSQRKPYTPLGCDNGHAGYVGLSIAEQMKSSPATAPLAGVVLLHKGDWRRASPLQICSEKAGDLRIQLPMSPRLIGWIRDGGSTTSPFGTHTFDPALPQTYSRRVWGLMLAPVELPKVETAKFRRDWSDDPADKVLPFARARCIYGVVGLDRYKDYILDWPDSGMKYPRAFNAGKTADQLSAELAQSSLPDEVKKKVAGTFCSFADPQQRAGMIGARFQSAVAHIKSFAGYFISCPTPSNHTCCGAFEGAPVADDVLAQPELSPQQRKELRARLALLVYLYQEPDVMNYGSGIQTGNLNMDTARFFPGIAYVPLVGDHPMYDAWRKRISEYAEYKLGMQMAPGGGWVEYGTYHMHGFRIRHVLPALEALKLPNADLLFDYVKQDMDYFTNLLTPHDSRYGARLIPGLANSEANLSDAFFEAAGGFASKDPEFAGSLLGAWMENGTRARDLGSIPLNVKPRQPELKSRNFPGFGVIFRAHQGADETWMMLRNGFLWSHWYIDPGHFICSSRGAVLVPMQPYQYYDSPRNDIDLYNTIRFGDPKNQMPYGWPDSNILDCSFGGTVEYAWSSTGVPDWFINPGISDGFKPPPPQSGNRPLDPAYKQKEGAFEWDRQVFFMKGATAQSPNYFVFRDTTKGEGQLASYLNLNLLGRKSDLNFSGGRVTQNSEFPTKLDIFFPDRPEIKAELHEEALPFASQLNGLLKGSPNWKDGKEQHTILRIPGAPNEGYAWVIWPRGEKEAPPTVTQPSANVIKIEHREGVDYVFAAADSFKYESGDISFEGRAGAVRVRQDHAMLAITSGPGRVAYKKQVLSGSGPVERKVPLTGEKTEKASAAKSAIVIPASAPDGFAEHRHESGQAAVRKDNIVMEGGAAAIYVKGDTIRFVAPAAEYVKLSVGNVGVRGLGPFDLTFTPESITGRADGTMRTLVTTWPEKLVRPMYKLDGRRWYAGWADDPSIGKGTKTPQYALAFAVSGGPQSFDVSEWKFPNQPPAPPRRVVAAP